MPRKALPQNFTLTDGTLIEGFENVADWIVTTSTVSADTVNFREGSQGVKVTAISDSSFKIDKTISLDLSDMTTFSISLYIPDLSVYDSSNFGTNAALSIYLTSNDFGRHFQRDVLQNTLRNGWNLIKIGLPEWTNNGGESWTNKMTTMRLSSYHLAGTRPSVTYDACRKNSKGIPKVLFTFDDGWETVYTKAYPYMLGKGVKGTCWIISSLPDGTDVNYMRTSELQTMYANGWDLGMHTVNHYDLSTLSVADIDTQISGCMAWLNSKGFTRASSHMAYPGGGYNAQVLAELTKLGIKSARTTHYTLQNMPPDSIYELNTMALDNNATFLSIKAVIDNAINAGSTLIFMAHKIADAPSDSLTVATSVLQSIVDYCAQRKVDTPTISEWYAGLTNPRKKAV